MAVNQVECPTCHSNVSLQHPVTMPWSTRSGANRIDRYELVEAVGTGAFGTVYRAYDPELQRIVALKVLRAGIIADDNHRARFMEEGRSARPSSSQCHRPGLRRE